MSAERITLGTDILIYSIDRDAGGRHAQARKIVDMAIRKDCCLTLQAVLEFYAAATRKGRMPAADAAAQANDWLDMFPSLAPSAGAVKAALMAAASRRSSYWDALLIATAAEGGCAAILTEDLADAAVLGGVRVVNPFGQDGLTDAALRLLSPPVVGG